MSGGDAVPASDMTLDAQQIVATSHRLRQRILERFPDAGLSRIADRLVDVGERSAGQAQALRQPNRLLRTATIALIVALPAMLILVSVKIGVTAQVSRMTLKSFVEFVQAGIESLIFIGAGIVFLMSLETRWKRGRALRAVRELRVLAHLVDMHQLDKDPVYLLDDKGATTASSPKRTMTAFELNRYFDYCCELLALTGKLAALYGQQLDDAVAVGAVDQVESLTTGLSRKIWQKTMLLERVPEA